MRAHPVIAGWVGELLSTGGLAESTDKRYLSAFISFVHWYTIIGLSIMGNKSMEHADESLWLMWLAWMSKFYVFSSIRSAIFGIKHNFGLNFGFDPFKYDLLGSPRPMLRFRRALRQVKRNSVGNNRPPKFSLTKFTLLKLAKVFDFNDQYEVLIWAILTVGVSCLLRWSEITLANGGKSKLLLSSDFAFTGKDMGTLHLKDTKTKNFGDSMVVSFQKDGSACCPHEAMCRWLKFRNKKSKWLFCLEDGKPIKSSAVQKLLKDKLLSLNLCESLWISGVSLRKGGALTMALCGVPDRVIQAYGRWKSNAYRVYIDMTTFEKQQWNDVVRRHVMDGEPSVSFTSKKLQRRIVDGAL